jgi:hypothetical protein
MSVRRKTAITMLRSSWRGCGMDFTSLTGTGTTSSRPQGLQPDPNWLAVANSAIAPGTPLVLTVAPIDTNHLRLPADLAGRLLEDPDVIDRYPVVRRCVMQILDPKCRPALGNDGMSISARRPAVG